MGQRNRQWQWISADKTQQGIPALLSAGKKILAAQDQNLTPRKQLQETVQLLVVTTSAQISMFLIAVMDTIWCRYNRISSFDTFLLYLQSLFELKLLISITASMKILRQGPFNRIT